MMNVPEGWKVSRLDQILPEAMIKELPNISKASELKALIETHHEDITARGNDPGFMYYRLLYDMSDGSDLENISAANIGALK